MMQGIGAEVSQKIRSAIKAKLMELGAYVDEELPDYVMVMVANKRSQSQMEEDLQLFLGPSTVVFTTWLHQVLQKLQEVTVASIDVKKEISSSSKRKSSDNDVPKKKKKSKQSAEVSKKHDKKHEKPESSKSNSSNNLEKTESLKSVILDKREKIMSSKSDGLNNHEKIESSKSDSSSKHEKIESSKNDCLNPEEYHCLPHEQTLDKHLTSKTHLTPQHDTKEQSPPMSEKSVNHGDIDKSPKHSVDNGKSSCKTEKQPFHSKEKPSEDSANILENKQSGNFHSDVRERRERSPSQGDDDDFINIKADLDGEDLMGSDLIEETNPKTTIQNENHSYDSQIYRNVPYKKTNEKQGSNQNMTKKSTERVLDARELLNRKKAARLADFEDTRPIPVISSNRRNRGMSPGHKDYRYSSDDKPSRRVISTKTEKPVCHKVHSYQNERSAKRYCSEDSSSTSRVVKSANISRRDYDIFVKHPVTLDRSKFSKDERPGRTHFSKVISISQTLRVEREVTRGRKVIEEDKITTGGLPQSACQHSDEEVVDTIVPSVVKVTPRPKRPLSQQANHTLILKAVADANKSLANAPPRQDCIQQKKRPRPETLFIRTLKDMIRPEKIAVSISNNNIQHRGESNKTDVDINISNISEECEDESIGMSVDDSSQDSSTYHVYKKGIVSDQGDDINNELITSVQKWLKGVNDADSVRLENENRVINNCIQNREFRTDDHAQTKETEEGPQFVVTLNGLDPAMFLSEQEQHEVDLLQWENFTENQENKEILQHKQNENDADRVLTSPLSPPAKKKRCSSPIVIVSKGSSLKSTEDLLEGEKTKVLERCKYWPSCRSGDNCNYHHPSVACKMFPACKFGDHCLFIHPQCKFNTACTRRDCAYSHTHSSVLTPIQPSAVSKGKCVTSSNIPFCRFYPKCANVNCQFYHPKPCRFGHYCTKKDCTFDHSGQMPSMDKLKWTRPQT